ncbi:transmembrane protein 131 isoform X2 [Temnothorax curvispinosus]|uniref:Transmembrane protein 131 isoform X2 n=1 Tax=Temnothorax curvispinosus TaxID=300111 RepID=A0A6J1QUM2_9HYME|nr:transmembrane protein 131 isoform X2 [Temnothorax curvispinosus]
MPVSKVFYCLFLLTLLDATSQIRPSLHGHNNAFVQDDNDVQYLLDNMPISMHKDFANTVHGAGDAASDEDKMEDSFSHISFEPSILDFKERQLGIPHQETVIMFNKDHNKTIHLSSISGNTRHFHSSFFQNKVIPPLGNTTFNVVFLGRDEGDIDTHLFIHTSDGTLKYQVKGISVSSPYRLRPVVDVKLPLNASFTPLIYMHNPHPEALQVMEVYSSGGEFQLELPSGEPEGSRELWEILPYQTKPIIRLTFNAYAEKNHTAYVRFKVNNTAEILVVAVEVEVKSGAGLHWGGSSGIINLGMGGSLQPPIRHPIALKNSAKKAIKIVNIINTPVSKALKLHFEPAIIPGETDIPIAIGMLVYDWKTGLDLQHFKGKLIIKAIGPGGSSQKLAIPWVAQVLQGGLEVNTSITHYCSPQSNQARNFSVVNKFKLPLAITNVTMCSNAKSLFTIKDFIPRVIKPEQKVNIFSLQLAKERKGDNVKMESSILIHSNVSVTEVPVLSYDGKLKKVMPGEKEDDMGTMNFGTVGSGTENEAIFALENQNPVNVELHSWGVNMPGAVLELMGCQNGPADLLDKEFRNITVCSHSGNQYIKPEFLAIFKIKVKTPMVEEDTIVGDVFVRTTYERFTLPVYMRVAHGKISLKKLIFTDCFPGSICVQQVKVHSTFSRPMEVTHIAPINKDDRIKYIPLEEATMPVISKGENNVGSIQIDPSVTCKQQCYLGLSLDTNTGSQWLNTMSLPSHTRDSDLNFLNTRHVRFINSTADGSWENITMRLDTTEVRSHKFYVNIKPYWPSLLAGSSSIRNKSVLMFPLTQVGNTSYRAIKLHNPSASPLIIQLVMDWNYPQGARLYHSLPMKFKPVYAEFSSTIPEEFKLEENADERELFEKQWGVTIAPQSLPLYLNPSETRTIRVAYTPFSTSASSGFLYIRNNMTILEVLRMSGRGASAQFRFGHRKPGSITPLLFELTDKHLKDCERDRNKLVTTLTVKRSFTARNTGELPIEIYGFYINDWHCEGYGFKVLDCTPFKLSPNATKRIEIAFTPDFTLSRVERKLLVMTSMGPDAGENVENGVVILNLLATLPAHSLNLCASVLARPSWEGAVQKAAIILSSVLMLCVAVVSFLEADRILREGLANYSKENPVQPPLDLRLLSHISTHNTTQGGNSGSSGCIVNKNEKIPTTSDEKSKTKKDEAFADWSLMNVKKCKDKDAQKGLKIPDWSAEEERKFKLDIESKDLLSFKRSEESSNVINNLNVANMTSTYASKKKNNKKQNNVQEAQSDNCMTNDALTDIQLIQEKKYNVNAITKSSPTSNRKGKTQSTTQSSVKEESKLNDHEVQMDTTIMNNNRVNKSDNKRNKQTNSSGNNNSNHNNHVSLKKLEQASTQKTVHLSEEETSSTTTESSTHDETTLCKSSDHLCGKQEKLQRKPISKKSKPQSIPPVPCIDYKDNYEGDCDDDEYDKEKQNNPNRWKTNTTRSTTKHHIHNSHTVESSFKSRQNKNPPRKEKTVQKRRVTDKTHVKSPPVNGNISQKEDVTRSIGVMPTPLPPPPPSCWGENRAKFSDVVARSPEIVSPFSNLNHMNHKSQTSTSNLFTVSVFNTDVKDVQCAKPQSSQESPQTPKEYNLMSNPAPLCNTTVNKNKSLEPEPLILQPESQHSNSYFINTFTEHPFERELVPYDDLPETDEPLVELETPEEDTRCQLWEDTSPIINLLSESTNGFQLESPKTPEKPVLSDLKDNWTVDTNWEPLHTRAAVGEERGVWGINTGGVWAAAPWGAAAPPMISQTLQSETDTQERSGFDPFRSLSTIWTPSSTESWRTKRED